VLDERLAGRPIAGLRAAHERVLRRRIHGLAVAQPRHTAFEPLLHRPILAQGLTQRRSGLLNGAENQRRDRSEVMHPMFLIDPFVPLAPRTGAFLAPVDIVVGEHDVVLTFDLPGVKGGDLDLEVLDRELVLRGERKLPQVQDDVAWAHAERPFGAFERRIRLPEGVDPDAITASMDDGVLSLIVPKPERLTPRRSRSSPAPSNASSRPAPLEAAALADPPRAHVARAADV